jgi:hypothetical protein
MEFTWTFPQFIVNPQEGGLSDVVTAINWFCTGTNGTFSSSMSGTVQLVSPNPAQFVPYDEITQEMAFEWVSSSISMPAVQNQIMQQVNQIAQPSLQPQIPPFGN